VAAQLVRGLPQRNPAGHAGIKQLAQPARHTGIRHTARLETPQVGAQALADKRQPRLGLEGLAKVGEGLMQLMNSLARQRIGQGGAIRRRADQPIVQNGRSEIQHPLW
jgi:hypothetical protein